MQYVTPQRPEQVIKADLRLDGRGFEEFRSVFFKLGVISQASGSAYAEFNNTKVMVGVYGPRKIDRRSTFTDQGRLQVDVKLASFATRQRGIYGQTPLEKEYSSMVQTALEAAVQRDKFPKATVDVYACILEAGGSEVGVVTTAASLALADAGIEMWDLVTACCVSRVEGLWLLDPTADEAFREDGSVVLAIMPSTNQVTQLVSRGELSTGGMKEAVELCLGGCMQLDGVLRDTLRAAAADK